MKVVQTVKKVTYVTSEHRQYSVVSVLTDESNEMDAHLIEEFSLGDSQHLIDRLRKSLILFQDIIILSFRVSIHLPELLFLPNGESTSQGKPDAR